MEENEFKEPKTSSFELFRQNVGPKGEQPSSDMVPFEEKAYMNDDGVHMQKGIFIDGTLFDWGVDEEDYKQALAMGPKYKKMIEDSIAKHFLESLSEFMGRRITFEEVEKARETGWIKKPIRWI